MLKEDTKGFDGDTLIHCGEPRWEESKGEEEARSMARRMRGGAVRYTLTVLSTAPEKRRPLETARAVTLP